MAPVYFLLVIGVGVAAVAASAVNALRKPNLSFGRMFASSFVAGVFLPLLILILIAIVSAWCSIPNSICTT